MTKEMKLKNLILGMVLITLTSASIDVRLPSVQASDLDNINVENNEELDHKIEFEKVEREEKLKRFLEKYNSPLVENADTFVEVADEYGMDYRMLPAIACLESGCGKALIEGSYNPFGWGVYGDNYIAFDDYDHAIQEVGKGLYEGYILKGADTVEKIAPIYNPPHYMKWQGDIRFFMDKIENS